MAEEIPNKSLISKRSQKLMTELQFQLNKEIQSLTSQYTVLVGGLMACDEVTQKNMLIDYRDQLYSVHAVLGRLCVMMDKLSREF
jgi:hypothetical protein